MGCQLGKPKKNQQLQTTIRIIQENTTQSQSLQQSQNDKIIEKKKKVKWISQTIPRLQLQESDLYRRRIGLNY